MFPRVLSTTEWLMNPIRGNRILKAMSGDIPVTAEMAKIIEGVQLGFLRRTMDRRFWPDSTQNMINDWAEGKHVKAVARSPFALVEQTARPIMEWLVPRQKFGVFSEILKSWMDKHPNATHEEFRKAAQDTVNNVEERLGQVNYDRLFVNNTAKNLVQGIVRAPGWTGGTILQIGRGLHDLAGNFKDLATGKPTELSDRSAYTLALVVTTALANGLLTKLFTGKDPDEKDLLAFRTGKFDEKGNPERFMLPTYMKDIYSYGHKPMETLAAKQHPMVGLLTDITKNRDYYGRGIRHRGDPMIDQFGQLAGYTVKAFEPFWMRGVQREKERGSGTLEKALPLIGVMPARQQLTETPAQSEARELARYTDLTTEQAARGQLHSQLRNRLTMGDRKPMMDAFHAGKISRKELENIIHDSKLQPLVRMTRNMELADILKVWGKADDAERKLLRPLIEKKWMGYTHNRAVEQIKEMRDNMRRQGFLGGIAA